MKKIFTSKIILLLFNITICYAQTVSTFAGTGATGSADGAGTVATFFSPTRLAVDGSCNVYVADFYSNKIRKITPAGVVSTFAGSGIAGSTDGTGTAASFKSPHGVAVDANDNVYVADYGNFKIRKISPAGVVTTFAGSGYTGTTDGIGVAASFNSPMGIAIDGDGNIYVADANAHKIRKISPAREVTTFAGSGATGSTDAIGTAASFHQPMDVATDNDGNIYVADYGNNKIRKISPAGEVSTFAGSGSRGSANGTGAAASFYNPIGIGIDGDGSVYVADFGNNKIRKISPTAVVTTLAGSGARVSTDGVGAAASFNAPLDVVIDANANIYVADNGGQKIRKITIDGVLPVALTTFTAKANGNNVQLQWQTANEHNNKGFEIWREGERQEGFVKISEVSTTFNSPLSTFNYNYTDKKPLNGNNYYKLVQIDNNGKATELGVKQVAFSFQPYAFSPYPNPFQTHLTIVSSGAQIAEIANISGQLVGHFRLNAGENTINTSTWPIGIYILKTPAERVMLLRK